MRSNTIRDRLARRKSLCFHQNLFEARTLALFVHTLRTSGWTSNRFTLFWCLAWNYQLSFSSRNAHQQRVCSFFTIWLESKYVLIDLIYTKERNQDLQERKRANKISNVVFDAIISLTWNFVFIDLEFRILKRDSLVW